MVGTCYKLVLVEAAVVAAVALAVAVAAAAAAAAVAELTTGQTLAAIVHSIQHPYFFNIDKHLIKMKAESIHCLTLCVAMVSWHS